MYCTVSTTITFWIHQVFKGIKHFWSRLLTDSDLTSLFLSSVLPVSHWSFLSGRTGLWRLCKCTTEHDGHLYSFGCVGILWQWKFIIIMLCLVTDQSFTLWRPHHHHTGVHPPGWSSHHLPCIQKWTVCRALVALLWSCNCLKYCAVIQEAKRPGLWSSFASNTLYEICHFWCLRSWLNVGSVGPWLCLSEALASLVKFQRSRRLLGVCYIVVKVNQR